MMKTSIKPECTTCTYKQQRMSMNIILALQNVLYGFYSSMGLALSVCI